MFTGIVQGKAKVVDIIELDGFRRMTIALPAALGQALVTGASIANNGCCLTISAIDGNNVSFDLIRETLSITNLGTINVGDEVNIERAARIGDEIGGHLMSGHIICQAEIKEINRDANNTQIRFVLPDSFSHYLFNKGFIGIDGISLTLASVENASFTVNLIPETLSRTNLGKRGIGEYVNIEIDPQTQAIVETVERILAKTTAGT